MSNMSYCRFRNTLGDLQDCYDALLDEADRGQDEERAAKKLVSLCRNIAAEFLEWAESEEEDET